MIRSPACTYIEDERHTTWLFFSLTWLAFGCNCSIGNRANERARTHRRLLAVIKSHIYIKSNLNLREKWTAFRDDPIRRYRQKTLIHLLINLLIIFVYLIQPDLIRILPWIYFCVLSFFENSSNFLKSRASEYHYCLKHGKWYMKCLLFNRLFLTMFGSVKRRFIPILIFPKCIYFNKWPRWTHFLVQFVL